MSQPTTLWCAYYTLTLVNPIPGKMIRSSPPLLRAFSLPSSAEVFNFCSQSMGNGLFPLVLTPGLTDVPLGLWHASYVVHGVSPQHFHARAVGFIVRHKAAASTGKDVLQETLCPHLILHAQVHRDPPTGLVFLTSQQLESPEAHASTSNLTIWRSSPF